MPFQNKQIPHRNKIAYLGALTLLFSYAEMILPRFTPFFRLGFGNIALLLAFNLNFFGFLLLVLIKAFAASFLAGTLFSPFLLISVGQSLASGTAMYLVFHLNKSCHYKLFSIYGISIIGSAVSATVQIGMAALYLGSGTFGVFGPILLFNAAAGIITAFFSQFFKIPQAAPRLAESAVLYEEKSKKLPLKGILTFTFLIAFSVLIFTVRNLIFLSAALLLSLVLQKISGRKILVLPHIFLWIFILVSCLMIPSGKVLYKIMGFSITEGALLEGIAKALKLSAASAISQCCANLRPSKKYLLGLSLAYYRGLLNVFHSTKGNILKKIMISLSATELTD